jgi:DNA segregation ATPase FtsK/SpoIIIE-like protein
VNNSPSLNPFREARLNTSLDYRPEWDVLAVNEPVSDWLEAGIRGLKGRATPDPGLVIPVLLAPPGYGKTHLFGRIAHRLNQEALFIFVPQVEDVRRPLDHIRWHVVESLFAVRQREPSILAQVLARLCQKSFLAYWDKLPPSLAARHAPVQARLQANPASAFEIVSRVDDLAPFLKLAQSVARGFPEVRADVARALALAWSPEADSVRHWLRGESLPENDLARLQLGEEPPHAAQVLRAAAGLLRFQLPIVLCCDQLEAVLVDLEEGPIRLTNELMGLLQMVPNQLVVLSCLEDKWQAFVEKVHGSFKQRIRIFKLETLNGEQAVELVWRRLQSWPDSKPERGDLWPFRKQAVREFGEKQQPGPRGLVMTCARAYERWAEDGQDTLIESLDGEKRDEDLAALFTQTWNAELDAIKSSPQRTPENLAEDRLFRAVNEALTLAREGRWRVNGVGVRDLKEAELRWTNNKKPVLNVSLAAETATEVVVTLTKINNGTAFLGYFNALRKAADDVAGIVLIHALSDLRMGPKTQVQFDAAREKGKLRAFSLTDSPETFARLECFLALRDKARAKELQLGRQTISDEDCSDLAIKTAVMENLDLFQSVCAGWKASVDVEGDGGGVAVAVAAPRGEVGATKAIPASPPAPLLPTPLGPATTTADPDWSAGRLKMLVDKLKLWSLPVEADGKEIGPTFARLRVRPLGKTSVNKVRNKAEDLKIHLGLEVCPLVAAQAGYISVDVQLPKRKPVSLDETLAQLPADSKNEALIPVGLDVAGKVHWLNLADPSDCHLLVAGTTGSGKSEFLKALIAALARRLSPKQLQFVLIDPKKVTFNFTGKSPYFRHPVTNDFDEALPLIEACFAETRRRYDFLKDRHLENISQLPGAESLPRVVVLIDEFADLMADPVSKKVFEKPLKQIGALARAAGIHLILATQRPEASVVTPLLRSNLPGRVALHVASAADSKLILGGPEAANLLGKGDLLWKHGGGLLRLQSPFVTREEIDKALQIKTA